MNKKSFLSFAGIYLFLYLLNYLQPMAFGDDYLYSFIWQGKAMNVPLDENAIRIASWHDIFVSQWSHYFTWGGRTVAHILVQFFLWMGKNVFNFCNAFIGVLLVAEIYWCIHRGNVSLNFKAKTVCWIFFVIWAFTPGFASVFFWLTAACNYLWTNVLLLAFLIPYIRKYYSLATKCEESSFFAFFMFVFGIIAGWTNENSVCWIILVLLVFIFKNKREKTEIEKWMVAGVSGLLIGYALLIFAPGNAARLYAEQSGGRNWLNLEAFKASLKMFLSILFFQIFLWFFSIRAIFTLKQEYLRNRYEEINKEILIVKVLCALALSTTGIMFFSPGFPARSGFFGMIQLIIATGILLRLQEEYGIELIQLNARKFLFYVGTFYFAMTAMVTSYYFYKTNKYFDYLLASVEQAKMESNDKVLTVEHLRESTHKEDMLSGFHIPKLELSENEDSWINVAFARYYGIKGIRMVKEESEEDKSADEETIKAGSDSAGSLSR